MKLLVTLFVSVALDWLAGGRLQNRADFSVPEVPTSEWEKVSALEIAPLVSTDTLSDFSESAADLSLDRLALWLLDADVGEIALLFNELSARKENDYRAISFILNAWARHDPDAVIAATQNGDFYVVGWFAIATQHPGKAFEKARSHFEKTDDKDPISRASRRKRWRSSPGFWQTPKAALTAARQLYPTIGIPLIMTENLRLKNSWKKWSPPGPRP